MLLASCFQMMSFDVDLPDQCPHINRTLLTVPFTRRCYGCNGVSPHATVLSRLSLAHLLSLQSVAAALWMPHSNAGIPCQAILVVSCRLRVRLGRFYPSSFTMVTLAACGSSDPLQDFCELGVADRCC